MDIRIVSVQSTAVMHMRRSHNRIIGIQTSLPGVQGTCRTKEYLNIFLEFVPGGSIASLLAKFGEQAATLASAALTFSISF